MSTIKSNINQRHDSVVTAVDSGVIGVIFGMFTTEAFQLMLEGLGHYILFPMAALLSVYRSVLAIKQAQLDKHKNGTVAKALVEIVSTMAVITAVIGGIVAAATFVLASPIIFTAVLGSKTLYHLGAAIYYFGKSNVSNLDVDKKSRYRTSMQGHLKSAFVLALSTIAVSLVMLAAHTVFAWVGIAASVFGIGFSIGSAIKAHRKIKQAEFDVTVRVSSIVTIDSRNVMTKLMLASPTQKPVTASAYTSFPNSSEGTNRSWGCLFNRRPKNKLPILTETFLPGRRFA